MPLLHTEEHSGDDDHNHAQSDPCAVDSSRQQEGSRREGRKNNMLGLGKMNKSPLCPHPCHPSICLSGQQQSCDQSTVERNCPFALRMENDTVD
ncbi:Ribonuclease PH [Trichinella pseudospiralis]